MNVVLGRAEYIETNVEDERLVKQSQLLCRTVDELVDVINDIRIVQQSLRTEVDTSVSVDCGVLLAQLADEMQTTHETATLSVDIQEPLSLKADDRLSIALEHIVENAIVHNSDSADVEIVATPIEESERVEIQVLDDGPGIPPSERLVATNPEATSPLEHGTGLGLWVASMIVKTLGGDLSIDDNDPDGSIVTLRLPRANPATRVS
jgi:signal transduction histidine kinase